MNKVLVAAILSAFIQALIPIISKGDISAYDAVLPLATVLLGVLSRNLHGTVWSIAGIVAAAGTSFYTAHPTPDGLTIAYVLSAWVLPLALQVVGAFSGSTPLPPTEDPAA